MGEPERAPAQHVEPRGEQWAVRAEGAQQAFKLFASKEDAEARAVELAEKEHGSVVVHDREGNVHKRWDNV
jgi:hypothetical protein